MDELERIKKEKMEKLARKLREEPKTEIKVSDGSFAKDVLEQSMSVPVVVDFWAEWCMPCVMLAPVLEKLTKEYNGKIILAKVNVDENPQSSTQYKISSIPAVKMFKEGKIVDEFVGALPEPNIRQWLDKNV